MKYARIINKGECLSSINGNNSFNWKNIEIKEKSGRSEWDKYGFYPNNQMVGLVVDTFENTLWGFNVFVLYIEDKYFVPMKESGIEFISEEEYNLNANESRNIGKSSKTRSLHEKEDLFHEKKDLFHEKEDLFHEKFKSSYERLKIKNQELYNTALFLEAISSASGDFSVCLKMYADGSGQINDGSGQKIVSFHSTTRLKEIMEKSYNIGNKMVIYNEFK